MYTWVLMYTRVRVALTMVEHLMLGLLGGVLIFAVCGAVLALAGYA